MIGIKVLLIVWDVNRSANNTFPARLCRVAPAHFGRFSGAVVAIGQYEETPKNGK
jgi:hypothetical protein